ncbi:hypothetical protein [Paraflavitalea pollutisoli]|uniref:hypothetical protein n=1 Tax=Paraflavitalea pollutisoli TaxID=3034143 RepID=UPI0023ECD506|nr:hypothetical protein [Paraflavitalea sp. H1-2-19X]
MKFLIRLFIIVPLVVVTVTAAAQTPCDTITGLYCKSIVADTVFNPFVTGVLGNWRANRSYTYYARRTEQDPASQTNIRKDGTFNDFTAFWAFQSNQLKAAPDTNRWVWNSEITMFNRRGAELENRDPLGRYNASLYGYSLTMPVAVIQNSRYRESAFEGFEDYVFNTKLCDTACAPTRHWDFSMHQARIDTAQAHTGLRSLKVPSGQQVNISFLMVPAGKDSAMPRLKFMTKPDNCLGTVLQKVSADSAIVLPSFSPAPATRMLMSVWVKEVGPDSLYERYTQNKVMLTYGSTGLTFYPAGPIIEGWQRYEGVFTTRPDLGSMTVSLQSIGTNTVYFDDLRIHPYNANMKSFVFHPVNLRLLAELDENNYATMYEYDDEGTLIRLKKETQRGIKTIKETRSALVKEN